MAEITEKTTIAELIEIGKAEYVTIRQKAKRIEELESQIKSCASEKDRLERCAWDMPQWRQDFDGIVFGQIGQYMKEMEAKESEDN